MRILNPTLIALIASVMMMAAASVANAEPTTEAPAQDAHGEQHATPNTDAPADTTGEATHAADHGDTKGSAEGAPGDAHHADTKEHGGDAHHADTKEHGGDAHHGDAKGHDGGHGDAHHGDHHDAGIDWLGLAQHLLNLTVLLGVLFFFGRKAVGDALRQRGLGIRNDLTDAARERDEARQRRADVEARLTRFETELANMRTEAEQSAKDEELKLVQRAQEASNRIAETAERNIRDEVVRAQVALRKEAVELAVKLAEDTLKGSIKADDHRRLARQFLESLDD